MSRVRVLVQRAFVPSFGVGRIGLCLKGHEWRMDHWVDGERRLMLLVVVRRCRKLARKQAL